MSATIVLPPSLEGRGYFVSSIDLYLILVVHSAPDASVLTVVVEADAKPFLVGWLPRERCPAPVDGGFGELVPIVAFESVGDHRLESPLHLICSQHQPTLSRRRGIVCPEETRRNPSSGFTYLFTIKMRQPGYPRHQHHLAASTDS